MRFAVKIITTPNAHGYARYGWLIYSSPGVCERFLWQDPGASSPYHLSDLYPDVTVTAILEVTPGEYRRARSAQAAREATYRQTHETPLP